MPAPFVDQFLEFTKEAESPESFFRWSAYAAIAAMLRDNVYLDLGITKVWPNIYVLLMARSAAMRKSIPLRFAGDLVRKLKTTKVISGRTSIQALVRELGQCETDAKTGAMQSSATGILLSEELSSFSPEDPATIPILTDLYDNHTEWSSNLVSTGKTTLKNTCITMLAATNEPLFRQVYTSLALRGGLLGRTFVIRESRKRACNSLMYTDIEDDEKWLEAMSQRHEDAHLKNCLVQISSLKGRAIMEFEARKEHDRWYRDLQKHAEEVNNDTGVIERIHTGALKVALILAVQSTYGLSIKKCHMEEAIFHCVGLLKNYEVISMGSGKSQSAEQLAILLTYLYERKGSSTIRNIIRDNWQHFDFPQLKDVLIPTLVQAGLIRESGSVEEMPGLILTPKGMETFEKKV